MRFRREKKEPVLITREITVKNPSGIHARPAAELARRANSFRSEICIVKEGERFSATSVMDLMRANLANGGTVTLEAHGTDAEAAIEGMLQVLATFDD
ncbi:HPr family phosphocarrier protein [soil metagenome]